MKILITGGTGFYGRHLVWRAAAEGAQVVFTGRNAKAAAQVQALAPAPVQFEPLSHAEPGAQARLTDLAQGCDLLIHCAALSSPWGSPASFDQANLASTAEVVAACQAQGVRRLVHISTPSLYFDYQDRLAIAESSPLPPPVNDYARSKRAAEALIARAGLPEVAILRPRALFGPWDQTIVPRILRVMQHGAVPVMRQGVMADLTYIDNAVDAAWLAGTLPLPRPLNVWNISNGEPMDWLVLLQAMADQFGLPLRTRRVPWPLVSAVARTLEWGARLTGGREPPLTRYSAGVLAFSMTLDISSARQELGYAPRVPLLEGIARHAAWWRQTS